MANLDSSNGQPLAAPKHLVVLQLTRAGDLLQTYQALEAVRQDKASLKITLVARKHYANTLKFMLEEVCDQIITIDTPKLFSGNLSQAKQQVSELIKNVCKIPVDALVNLSYCKPSRYLTGLIPAKHKLGPWIGSDNQEVITDRWSQLLYATVTQGPLNPFHLVDLFKLILGTKLKSTQQPATETPRKKWIVVHPFASTSRKRWKVHKWGEILYKVSRDFPDHNIFVVGSPGEVDSANELFDGALIKTRKNIVNLVGQTSLHDVFERLKVTQLFIGHDSMIGHLASIAKTRSLTLSLGSVRPWETTPYGANNIVLSPRTKCFPCFAQESCAQYLCHADIPYQLVTDVVALMIKNTNLKEELTKKNNPFITGSCQIHQTKINPTSGLMDFDEIDHKPEKLQDIMRVFYRMMWGFTIGEMEENRGFPTLSRDAHASLLQVMDGLRHLHDLAEFGKKYSLSVVEEIAKPSPSLSKIKAATTKIDEIDRLAHLVKKPHPTLAPIVDYFSLVRSNLLGGNIVEIAQHSFFMYQDMALSASVMNELLEKTIAEYKILQQRGNTPVLQR